MEWHNLPSIDEIRNQSLDDDSDYNEEEEKGALFSETNQFYNLSTILITYTTRFCD